MKKGIMILYHLVQDCEKQKVINSMSDYKKVYDEFWYYRNNDLHKIVDKYLKLLFSNINTKFTNGYISNPDYLKSATLIIDSYLNFYTINKSNKMYNKGYITPYLCDNDGMIIQIFETNIKNTDILNYNLQIKICVLLNNVIKFVNKYNIPEEDIHLEWKKQIWIFLFLIH